MTHWGYIDKGNDPRDISPVTGRYAQKERGEGISIPNIG
jgi:hypothetical protein